MVWSSAPRNIASRMPITIVRTPAWSSGLAETASWESMGKVILDGSGILTEISRRLRTRRALEIGAHGDNFNALAGRAAMSVGIVAAAAIFHLQGPIGSRANQSDR